MLRVEDRDRVRLLTLDRPEKSNALHPDLIGRLEEALEDVSTTSDVHVVVLTGAGKRFCAGLDLGHLSALEPAGRVEYMASLFSIFRRLWSLPQPVIAAVNGPAIAGGFDLAAFCDLRLCSASARFSQAEVLLGLTQVAYPLYKTIGLSRAAELALTGKSIDATEAYRIGLVSSVHDGHELLERAMGLAREMSDRPREALFQTKRLTRELIEMDTEAAFGRMLEAISERLRSREQQEALAAYMQQLKRR